MSDKLISQYDEKIPVPTDFVLVDDGSGYYNKAQAGNLPGGAGGATTLTAPSLSVSGIDSDTIRATIGTVADETNIQLQVSNDGSTGWADVPGGLLAANTTTFDHNSIPASTTRYYRVRSVGDGVTFLTSGWSSVVNASTTSGGGYDADADTFFTNYSITDVGQKDAVNPMVVGAKTASLWGTKILDWMPIVGATSGKHAGNLRRPTSPYELTYRGTPTHSATGMACPSGDNGATINVNFDASGGAETASINDIGIGIYVHTNVAVATLSKFLMGLVGTNSHGFSLIPRYSNDQFYCQMTDSGGNIQAATPGTDSRGFWFMTRTASNVGKLFHNGVQVGSTYTGSPSTPAGNKLGVGGGFDNFSAYQGSEHTVSNFIRTIGVTDGEVATLSDLINDCETALGRNTY